MSLPTEHSEPVSCDAQSSLRQPGGHSGSVVSPGRSVHADIPSPPPGRRVVLHTRVVTGTGGGPDKTILLSAPFLAGSSYWLAAGYLRPPGDPGFEAIRQRAGELNSPLIEIDDRGPFDLKLIGRLIRICRRLKVDIWHGHDYKTNLLGILIRPFWRMKLVTTLHGWVKHTSRTPLYYAVDRFSLRFYRRLIAVSEDLAAEAIRAGVPEERVVLIHNAIDEQQFKRKLPAGEGMMRQERRTPLSRTVLGALGRLSPEKGFDLLLGAFAELVKEGRDIELWIGGEGDGLSELRSQADSLGIGDRVWFCGFVADTVGFFESLDGFVLSSLREGLPNVVLEAASMSVPIVATRVAGIPGMLEQGRHAVLCEPGSLNELAGALRLLLDDPEAGLKRAVEARRLIEEKYSFTRRMEKVRAVYDEVLGVESSGPA